MKNKISILNNENDKLIQIVEGFYEKGIIERGYIGFPHYVYDGQKMNIDAILITKKGVLALIDKRYNDVDPDKVFNKIEITLKNTSSLVKKRKLLLDIDIYSISDDYDEENMTFNNFDQMYEYYINEYVEKLDEEKIRLVTNTIEGCLVKEKKNRIVSNLTNIISNIENNISNYDNSQLHCLKNYDEKIQVISGLAGSGKTIILCKKIAEILLNEDKDIRVCITFTSRSLKNQIKKIIKGFLSRNTDNVDYFLDKIEIKNSWGDNSGDGFYSSLCKKVNTSFIPLYIAKQKNKDDPFYYCCKLLLDYIKDNEINCKEYDYIFVDEAQDNNELFLQLCFKCLNDNGKLIYAYDEFQDLSDHMMKSPEDIFGKEIEYVSTPLSTCYRTPKEILVTAHSIGMGINSKKGICQFFDDKKIWETIGYTIENPDNCFVNIKRESPAVFKNVKDISFIEHFGFDSLDDLSIKLVEMIKNDLNEGLLYDDIMVIDLAMWQTADNFEIFSKYAETSFDTALAGYNNPNVFFEDNKIIYSYVHRAKGNEAYKVYIVNSQLSMNKLLRNVWRNRLFTSMTRSKLQVVLLSINGEDKDELNKEIEFVKENNYDLNFCYPSQEIIENVKKVASQNLKTNKILSDTSRGFDQLQKLGTYDKVEHISELIKGKFTREELESLIDSLKK